MTATPLLSVQDLKVSYRLPRPHLFARRPVLDVVDGVSFSIGRGRTFGIVGESGCGKSSTALAILRLIDHSAGHIVFDGTDLASAGAATLRGLRRRMQIVFQDPYSSLNPRRRVGDVVDRTLRLAGYRDSGERRRRLVELFEMVGLQSAQAGLYPHQFSGGQRQRIGIARALAMQPDLIVCDEPVSSLDAAIQAQILNLLLRLQREFGLTYLFISHDLAVVQHFCDDVAVMYLGRIVEQGSRSAIFSRPMHPYTRTLLASVPRIHGRRPAASAEVPADDQPYAPVQRIGCAFRSRCAFATQSCADRAPALHAMEDGHSVACHHPFVD